MLTQTSGNAELRVQPGKRLFIAAGYPGSRNYSIGAAVVKNYSATGEVIVVVPKRPSNSLDAAIQLDNLVNAWAGSLDAFSLYDIEQLLRRGGGPELSENSELGIPGVLSFMLVPLRTIPGN